MLYSSLLPVLYSSKTGMFLFDSPCQNNCPTRWQRIPCSAADKRMGMVLHNFLAQPKNASTVVHSNSRRDTHAPWWEEDLPAHDVMEPNRGNDTSQGIRLSPLHATHETLHEPWTPKLHAVGFDYQFPPKKLGHNEDACVCHR